MKKRRDLCTCDRPECCYHIGMCSTPHAEWYLGSDERPVRLCRDCAVDAIADGTIVAASAERITRILFKELRRTT